MLDAFTNVTCEEMVCCAMLSHFSCFWLFATPWAIAHQAPLSMGFSRKEYWNGLPCPLPGDLPHPGIKPASSALQVDSLPLSHQGSQWNGTAPKENLKIREPRVPIEGAILTHSGKQWEDISLIDYGSPGHKKKKILFFQPAYCFPVYRYLFKVGYSIKTRYDRSKQA